MTYPDINAPLRNDKDFRSRIYEGHHKHDSILETIVGLDMINDFPIGDALHLLDLGITKRFLNGWKCGSLNNHDAKWSASQTESVSKYLQSCKLPREIKRPVRSLDQLSRWKGTEYRTFLLYLSPIITAKYFEKSEITEHFLNFFCAVQICSRYDQTTENYLIARDLIKDFLHGTQILYGAQMFCSNMHNLSHLVDDVERFGPLDSFDAYPFESKLYYLKRLIRSGNMPLSQVANRICEIQSNVSSKKFKKIKKTTPTCKKKCTGVIDDDLSFIDLTNSNLYSFIDLENFCLDTESVADSWILTEKTEIVCVKYVIQNKINGNIQLCGTPLCKIYDFFLKPVRSSLLYIFATDLQLKPLQLYSLQKVSCKMVKIDCNDSNLPNSVLLPLIHTL